MVTHRIRAAVKAGLAFGLVGGAMGMVPHLIPAIPALAPLAFIGPLLWPATLVLGALSGALGMIWGGGYVRTLENSVVQGGVAGAVFGVSALLITGIGVAAAALLAGGDIASSVSSWAGAESQELMKRAGMALVSGIVGGVACAPLIIRIR